MQWNFPFSFRKLNIGLHYSILTIVLRLQFSNVSQLHNKRKGIHFMEIVEANRWIQFVFNLNTPQTNCNLCLHWNVWLHRYMHAWTTVVTLTSCLRIRIRFRLIIDPFLIDSCPLIKSLIVADPLLLVTAIVVCFCDRRHQYFLSIGIHELRWVSICELLFMNFDEFCFPTCS